MNLIRKIISRIKPVNSEPVEIYSSDEIENTIQSAQNASAALKSFLGEKQYSPVSIGQNCNSAWYLKQVGLKKESYPFDWIFSSADILQACLDDNFQDFLKKEYIKPRNNGYSAGHELYHSEMFNHRNPLKTEANYQYYQRCIARFLVFLKSNEKPVFVCTIVNEPEKRISWSRGFDRQFKLPVNQSPSIYDPVMKKILSINPNAKFLFIEQYTEKQPGISHQLFNSNCFHIRFDSKGSNTGVKYLDNQDDFLARLIYSSLISNS